jgi:transposase
MTINGALDGPAFLAYVEQVLAPTLSAGETVVMDNVHTHKDAGVRAAIATKGAKMLYLPPYWTGSLARLLRLSFVSYSPDVIFGEI